jgi:hypothetical protein
VTAGGWYGLLAIGREAEEQRRAELAQPPAACPNDGEPLTEGPGGTRFCRFDGWEWPRDDTRPVT